MPERISSEEDTQQQIDAANNSQPTLERISSEEDTQNQLDDIQTTERPPHDQEEIDAKAAELQADREEHLRRTNRFEGTPERISSQEETQRQVDAAAAKQ